MSSVIISILITCASCISKSWNVSGAKLPALTQLSAQSKWKGWGEDGKMRSIQRDREWGDGIRLEPVIPCSFCHAPEAFYLKVRVGIKVEEFWNKGHNDNPPATVLVYLTNACSRWRALWRDSITHKVLDQSDVKTSIFNPSPGDPGVPVQLSAKASAIWAMLHSKSQSYNDQYLRQVYHNITTTPTSNITTTNTYASWLWTPPPSSRQALA